MVLLDILKPTRSATEEAPTRIVSLLLSHPKKTELPKRLTIFFTCADDDKQMNLLQHRIPATIVEIILLIYIGLVVENNNSKKC